MPNKVLEFIDKQAKQVFYSAILLFVCFFVAGSGLLLLWVPQQASAAQLTSRSLSISSGKPSDTGVKYTYSFTYVSSASAIQSIKFVACTTAIDTYGRASISTVSGCSVPTGININQGSQFGSVGGSWTNTTSFSRDGTGAGNCNPAAAGATNNVLCIKRTQAAAESAAAKTITWDTQTNPSTANSSFYVGVYLYSDTGWATPTDSGTVASAVVQTLTINAAVAEILSFCIGNTTVDSDSSGTVASDCSGVSGTAVGLGTLDSSKVSITPETTNCVTPSECTKNGVAMLRTNASNGATIAYDSIQQSGSNHLGTLRISGSTCNATANNSSSDTTDNSDKCFNVRTAQGTFTTTSPNDFERFGMTVAGVNCGSTTSYTCTGTATSNLVRDAAYDCDGTSTYPSTDLDQISGTSTCGYAWDESGTATQIASSTSSTIKQVDDEALILKFAAHPKLITPFGSYSAQSDFIAVATY
ncbi:MAG TPA: hypothetical protein VLF43_04225 [Candidatus Saccharimonadales bacterium]|nr:hypothetical protein [Candidatus Saccharimonadales bacterium]